MGMQKFNLADICRILILKYLIEKIPIERLVNKGFFCLF